MVERPLPGTPSKIPTIINKVIGGGKSKAEKERRKREEKEERERLRMEKVKGKKEEKAKTKEKARNEQEQSEAGASSGKQSLFQRLFTRSKSMTEDDVNANAALAQNPPAVPKHRDRIRQFRLLGAIFGKLILLNCRFVENKLQLTMFVVFCSQVKSLVQCTIKIILA